jgi:hypothetical protein
LLDDEKREVRLGVILLLEAFNRKDHTLARLLAWTAMKHTDLRREAISALHSVYTRAVLPQIFIFADAGYSSALHMLNRLIQTPEEVERGIKIARKYIQAEEYYLREAALFLLQRYSSMEEEGKIVLEAVKLYTDELFIDALKKADPEMVLEPLKTLKTSLPERYDGTHHDLASTIHVLEQKNQSTLLDGHE